MASLFLSEEATGELNLGASSAPVIQAAAIAAAHYYRMSGSGSGGVEGFRSRGSAFKYQKYLM